MKLIFNRKKANNIILFKNCGIEIIDMDSKELIWYKHNIKDVEFLGSKLRIKKSVPSIINRDKEYVITCKNENVIYQFVRCTLSREDSETDMTSNNKKLRDCLNDVLKHLEEDNPRYYRLKDRIFSKNLVNKLW